MGPYGGYLDGLKRATTFRRWRRVDDTPHGALPPHTEHVIRAGLRARPHGGPIRRLLVLAGPALPVAVLGLPIEGYYEAGHHVAAHVPAPFFLVLWTAIALVFAARAIGSIDRRSIRVTAALLNLAFPIWLFARLVL